MTTPARQPHPQRCETCKKRETLQCPIQDEDIYYKIKEQVTVPTGWEILTSCIGCASHSTHTSPPAPASIKMRMPPDLEEFWLREHDARVAKAAREQVLKELLCYINPDSGAGRHIKQELKSLRAQQGGVSE